MNSARLIYHIGPWRHAALWCVLAPFAALGAVLWWTADDAATGAAGIAVMAMIAACLAAWEWLVATTYVALTADGIELRQLGLRLRTAWPNVTALSLRRGREGFVSRTPLDGAGAARYAALRTIGTLGTPLYDEPQRQLLAERRFVPIEAFAWHLQHGTLARDVARLAPHVRIDDGP